MKKVTMFTVSDSVGETAELVLRAAASQFEHGLDKVKLRRFSHIETIVHIEEIVQLAKKEEAIIFFTLVKNSMRLTIIDECELADVTYIDLLGPIVQKLEAELDETSIEEPGLFRQLDEDYFKKIEAIEFAVRYDDGRDPRGILEADIVLLGISRTSKTPLSQYLALKRLKVANVPLVPEVDPPEELFEIDPKKCVGLVISPDKLNSIRRERLIALGLKDNANYAKIDRIAEEVAHFERVTDKIGCTVIDVTNRAIEETANEILMMQRKRK